MVLLIIGCILTIFLYRAIAKEEKITFEKEIRRLKIELSIHLVPLENVGDVTLLYIREKLLNIKFKMEKHLS